MRANKLAETEKKDPFHLAALHVVSGDFDVVHSRRYLQLLKAFSGVLALRVVQAWGFQCIVECITRQGYYSYYLPLSAY